MKTNLGGATRTEEEFTSHVPELFIILLGRMPTQAHRELGLGHKGPRARRPEPESWAFTPTRNSQEPICAATPEASLNGRPRENS